MCLVDVCVYVHIVCRYPQSPEGGDSSLGAGVTDVCEPFGVGASIQTLMFCKNSKDLTTEQSFRYCNHFTSFVFLFYTEGHFTLCFVGH